MFDNDAWGPLEFFFWTGLVAWAVVPLLIIGGGIWWLLS